MKKNIFAILMCTYNGEKYLKAQLESIHNQDENNWSLYVSDDGSTDQTLGILRNFQSQLGADRVKIKSGPNAGFSKNFISLIIDPSIKAQYYALSDQDDIWDNNKLSAARAFLDKNDPILPALYCGRTMFVDENGRQIGLSEIPRRQLNFKNALVQNIARGNTIVMNEAARDIFLKNNINYDVRAHDWLIYQIVTGTGGVVFYDHNPHVRYRQHSKNLIGMNLNLKAKMFRLKQFISGEFSEWNQRNLMSLQKVKFILENENMNVLESYSKACRLFGFHALRELYKSGVFRQNQIENFFLQVGVFCGRL